ncbi:MAG: TetR/AcrR family transcriptional regulator [Parvularculaceae bacterium]|nr:TetR/AcrR family transcriptional regulator [Parvularculaceae bacterium]
MTLSRRERKKQETRLRILEAALTLMAEKGYEAARVEEICALADVANATFFAHFPTKSALIAAFNEDVADRLAERLSAYDLPAIERLELLRALMLDEWASRAELLRAIVADAAAQDASAFARSSESLVALVAAIVLEGQTAGELDREFDPRLVAQCLVGAWRAATLEWARTGDGAEARRANRQALDLVLRGALPR